MIAQVPFGNYWLGIPKPNSCPCLLSAVMQNRKTATPRNLQWTSLKHTDGTTGSERFPKVGIAWLHLTARTLPHLQLVAWPEHSIWKNIRLLPSYKTFLLLAWCKRKNVVRVHIQGRQFKGTIVQFLTLFPELLKYLNWFKKKLSFCHPRFLALCFLGGHHWCLNEGQCTTQCNKVHQPCDWYPKAQSYVCKGTIKNQLTRY